jgi:hypothetical protein
MKGKHDGGIKGTIGQGVKSPLEEAAKESAAARPRY